MNKKIALISSTGASVVKTVYSRTAREHFNIDLVIVDRECGAKKFAEENNIDLVMMNWSNRDAGSKKILDILIEKNIDYVYLFFTRLLSGRLLEKYANKIINFHPSILPACPGLHGFEDTINSGAMLAGSTVHFVDPGMDTGKIIQQAYAPIYGSKNLRHLIFAQQCASLFCIHQKIIKSIDLRNFDNENFDISQGFLPNIDAASFSLFEKILNQQ